MNKLFSVIYSNELSFVVIYFGSCICDLEKKEETEKSVGKWCVVPIILNSCVFKWEDHRIQSKHNVMIKMHFDRKIK